MDRLQVWTFPQIAATHGDTGWCVTRGSSGPHEESTSQTTASRSVPPFSHGTQLWPIYTGHATAVAVGRDAMHHAASAPPHISIYSIRQLAPVWSNNGFYWRRLASLTARVDRFRRFAATHRWGPSNSRQWHHGCHQHRLLGAKHSRTQHFQHSRRMQRDRDVTVVQRQVRSGQDCSCVCVSRARCILCPRCAICSHRTGRPTDHTANMTHSHNSRGSAAVVYMPPYVTET